MVYILKAIKVANQFVSSIDASILTSLNLSHRFVNLGKLFFCEIFVSHFCCYLSYDTKV